jgi:hypothetical protein
MKLFSALVGLAALCGVALSTASASAMPVTVPGQASQASNIIQADYVCNSWGHCWDRPSYGDGYFHPHYYGGWGHRGWGGYGWHHWHPHYYGGWGYGGGWHHWHHHYHGGWGYGGWHHWHHWHQW